MLLKNNYFCKKINYFKYIIKTRILNLFNKLDNNNNVVFNTNGEGLFVKNLFIFFKKHSKGICNVFDVGANIGEYSKILLKMGIKYKIELKIHCFEPTQSCFNELLFRYGKNDCFKLNKLACSNLQENSLIFYDKKKSCLA